jgi:hypothetical protein
MNEGNSRSEIDCPIALFGRVEREVEDITAALNRAPGAVEKAPLARQLRGAISTLLDCKAYDANNANCRLCREFSQLRDKTAALVEQAAKLAR